jgi:hypothetical protein
VTVIDSCDLGSFVTLIASSRRNKVSVFQVLLHRAILHVTISVILGFTYLQALIKDVRDQAGEMVEEA